jgi:hypothetical protein
VDICFILRPFGIFLDRLLYFPHFGILYQEKSGNPDRDTNLSGVRHSNAVNDSFGPMLEKFLL